MELRTAKSIEQFIDGITTSVLRHRLREGLDDDLKVIKPDVKKDPNTANVSGQAKTVGDERDGEIMSQGDVEVGDIIEKLNAIRAGRSVRNPAIAQELETYFGDLDAEERIALFAYLKGIAEVVSGEHPGKSAEEPSDPDPRIEMDREGGSSDKARVTVKSGGGGEDTSPPVPIAVKNR